MTPTQNTISIAELEKVPIADIIDIMRRGHETSDELMISLKQVPFICFHIKSIQENMQKIIDSIEKNWDATQKQNERFLTIESFHLQFDPLANAFKWIVMGVSGAVGLALLTAYFSLILK